MSRKLLQAVGGWGWGRGRFDVTGMHASSRWACAHRPSPCGQACTTTGNGGAWWERATPLKDPRLQAYDLAALSLHHLLPLEVPAAISIHPAPALQLPLLTTHTHTRTRAHTYTHTQPYSRADPPPGFPAQRTAGGANGGGGAAPAGAAEEPDLAALAQELQQQVRGQGRGGGRACHAPAHEHAW